MSQSDKKDREINSDHGSVAAGTMENCLIQIFNGAPKEFDRDLTTAKQWESCYLKRLIRDCGGLSWLDAQGYQGERVSGVRLEQIYTPLWVLGADVEEKRFAREQERQKSSLVEAFNTHGQLVVTGAPGSGKSAFVNFMALALAGELLGNASCSLEQLTAPMPHDESKDNDKKQAWDHGSILPVRIILRDFAASKFFPLQCEKGDAEHVLGFLESDLRAKGVGDYFPLLRERLRQGKVLLFFDGLDEVSEAGERRERMLACISGFSASFSEVRKLVTCRPYAYQQTQWRLTDYREMSLADFTDAQIRYFIKRWYGHNPQYEGKEEQARVAELERAVLHRPALRELAARPLLLTLITYLHANRHDLPEQRGEVYERLLDLLIEKWDMPRFETKADSDTLELVQPSLAEFLKVDPDKIRLVLERLAFRVHAEQERSTVTADIRAEALTHQLVCEAKSREGAMVDPLKLAEYLRDRVGVLHQRGGENSADAIYTFPHRSFQEFLAAAYIRRNEPELDGCLPDGEEKEWQEVAAYLVKSDFDKWREVVLLAGSINVRKEPGSSWSLVESLFSGIEGDIPTLEECRGLFSAAEIVTNYLERDKLKKKHQRILETIRHHLHHLLTTTHLSGPDRVAAGKHLAVLTDTRPEVMEVDSMQFCRVPAGPFFMGSDENDGLANDNEKKGAGIYDIAYDYYIARYPVTVAQYREFVNDAGHEPKDDDCLKEPNNTPVVKVTWREALKFCAWLTKRWHEKGRLPSGYVVTLPNEPEWEKAARGGEHVPDSEMLLHIPIQGLLNSGNDRSLVLMVNNLPRRIYPWGDEMDEECLNYRMNIGTTSAVGCFPQGASPYGCEELSGNVWEWTRSAYEPYPYPSEPTKLRKREPSLESSVGRVVRGGSFYFEYFARCSARSRFYPDYRYYFQGFRVVLSPFTSEL